MIDINELRQSLGAVQPEEVAELLDRLEAAEKEAAYIKEVEFPRKMRAVAVGWETKCARLEQERDELRAKIESMEQQEPVATARINAINGNPSVDFVPGHRYLHHNDKLYLAPGAQPAPSMPSVPDLLESLRCACNYIDKLGGVSQQYRAMLASLEAKP